MIYQIIPFILSVLATNLPAQVNTAASKSQFKQVNKDIIALFQAYPLVAVGEGMHNSALTAEWLESLIHEKAFPRNVRNIVVEFGTSKYQSTMDDFVMGRDVPDSLLNKCWRNTTQLFVWDNPIYERFFREIRKINAALPEKRKIRVLLADLPFESRSGIFDEHAFHIIRDQILAKGQTGLLLFGDLHLVRRDIFLNYAPASETPKEDRTLVQFLDSAFPGQVFSLWGSVNTNDPAIKQVLADQKISHPSFHVTARSDLGTIDFSSYYPWADIRTDALGNLIDSTQFLQLPIKEITDGILFRGSWEDQMERFAPRPDEIYSDTAYVNELIARAKISGEKSRQLTFEYFKFRWSPAYDPFLLALETRDALRIDQEFERIRMRHDDLQWMPLLNRMGYKFLHEHQFPTAIAIFELATRAFPTAANAFDSLGDGYLAQGDKERAIIAFTKALELNPNNGKTQGKLKELTSD